MPRAEYLKTAKPELVVDLKLYPTEAGGKKLPISLGWGSPCTIQHELGTGWVGYDGWPLLIDGPLYPGESRQVGYVFLSGQEAVRYLRNAEKFYLWEGRLIGEAKIVDFESSSESSDQGRLSDAAPPWQHEALVACDVRRRGKSMSRRRRSYETGHRPKLLVVIDDTEECDRAVYFASRRAARIGGNVIMLRVMETHDQSQQWLGVADIMRAEARDEADAQLTKYTARAAAIAGISPECVVREGDPAEEILKLIDEDEDVFILVLGAGTGSEGPGPLVATIGRTAGDYPIPVAIVPGHLSDDEIDALSG